jgi:hypothetical protein
MFACRRAHFNMFGGLYDILHCSQPNNYPLRTNRRYEGLEWMLTKLRQKCAKKKIPIFEQLSTVQLTSLEKGELRCMEIVIDAFAEALISNLQLLRERVNYLERKLDSKTKPSDHRYNTYGNETPAIDIYEETKTSRPTSAPASRGNVL